MPLLDHTGLIADRWLRVADDAPAPRAARAIVSFARLQAEAASLAQETLALGVAIAADTRIDALRPWLQQVELIAIPFKSFTDGRGFSIARQLRLAGFAGEIRAVGPLIADQFAYLRSCGVDTVELDDDTLRRQPAEQWVAAIGAFSVIYQRSYGGPENILIARRRARAASTAPLDRAAAE